MTRAPAFQFYTGDWRKDPALQSLDHEHKGVWIDLMCIMFDCPERGRLVLANGSPMPDSAIANNLGIPEANWKQKRSTLLEFAVASEDERGVFFCRRMVRDEELRSVKVESGRKGGLSSKTEAKAKQKPSKHGSKRQSKTGVYRAEDEVEEEVVVNKTKDTEFRLFWYDYPKRSGGNPKAEAESRWRSNVKRGVDPDDMLAGVKRYAAFLAATKKLGTEYVMQASTFLGQREAWTEAWAITESVAAPVNDEGARDAERAAEARKRASRNALEQHEAEEAEADAKAQELRDFFDSMTAEERAGIETEAKKRARMIQPHGPLTAMALKGCYSMVLVERQTGRVGA